MRNYEILSCGAMLLMHRMVDESTERLGYKNGVHYVEFTSPEQMFELIRYYLTHDEEREKIAKAGHEFTIKHHKYSDRVREMLNIMQPALKMSLPR
ncbi:MAG: glycosyltransferase family 1 protein [Candidatus Omnitrophica bacterium]|nr:glycosyltransferase family 1 protein [Candidatus Omnitrophota bacterium]